MRKKFFEILKKQSGSATVEAVVAFTGFLLVFFTILGMVNYCRVQMLISSAVDTTAKELSQYAYFYEMSGLNKFDKALNKQATVGKENINEIIGTVDSLYGALSGAASGTVQDATNIANGIESGDISLEQIEDVINNIDDNAENIVDQMDAMSNKLEEIGNDPVKYMKSIVAIAGQEGATLAKRTIAASLAKMFVQKHFGENSDEADKTLKALGVVNGLEGLNFKMSAMFCDDKNQDIQIVVFYKVKLLQFFDWDFLEVDLCKQAVCRAWLGGDSVIEKVSATGGDMDLNAGANGETGNGSADSGADSSGSEQTDNGG